MIDKIFPDTQAAVADLPDGATLLVGAARRGMACMTNE